MTTPKSPSPHPPPYPYLSHPNSLHHPAFRAPWIRSLLSAPEITFVTDVPETWDEQSVKHNTFFNVTLAHPTGLQARLSFTRPTSLPTAAGDREHCTLVALGSDLDGMAGRVHGGFSALLLDHVLGSCAGRDAPVPDGWPPPATATMTVDYRAPVPSDSVVLARSWMLRESSGRKVWVEGCLEEGGTGRMFAVAKALFVNPRGPGKVAL